MYLSLKFRIENWYVCKCLQNFVSLHSLDTKLILIISPGHLDYVLALSTVAYDQSVRFSAGNLFGFDFFDWNQAKHAFALSNAKLSFRSITSHKEGGIFC